MAVGDAKCRQSQTPCENADEMSPAWDKTIEGLAPRCEMGGKKQELGMREGNREFGCIDVFHLQENDPLAQETDPTPARATHHLQATRLTSHTVY